MDLLRSFLIIQPKTAAISIYKGENMTPKEMEKMIARLQSKLDHYETEWAYLDRILSECGFRKGLMSLKKTVESMIGADSDMKIDEFGF